MHTEMWEHPAVQDNLATLRSPGRARRGARAEGRLAGGDVGAGRLADPADIVAAVEQAASAPAPSATSPALRVLVTAGGTREPIDPVRVIANRSSGKQGHAIAAEAARPRRRRSPSSPPPTLPVPAGVEVVEVDTRRRDAGRGDADRRRRTTSS